MELKKCQETQINRKSILKKGCETLRSNPIYNEKLSLVPDVTYFWMNKPRKLAICTPHKVGSQTWRYFFQVFINIFLNFPACFEIPKTISNMNYNHSNLLDMRNFQEQVRKKI